MNIRNMRQKKLIEAIKRRNLINDCSRKVYRECCWLVYFLFIVLYHKLTLMFQALVINIKIEGAKLEVKI
jgi:hypothetical protein